MGITVDLPALHELLAVNLIKINSATRPAAQAGAQVIYDEARRLAPVSKYAHMFHGTHGVYGPYSPGSLRDAIYQVFSKDNSSESKATYHISWNAKKAPYAWMVELGTSRAPAHPFLRPAYLAKSEEAAAAMKAKFVEAMQ